jgi:hypothetical protein
MFSPILTKILRDKYTNIRDESKDSKILYDFLLLLNGTGMNVHCGDIK